jgi:hypothetical protein
MAVPGRTVAHSRRAALRVGGLATGQRVPTAAPPVPAARWHGTPAVPTATLASQPRRLLAHRLGPPEPVLATRPRQEGWRRTPSWVHSAKATSPTTVGNPLGAAGAARSTGAPRSRS